MINKIQQSCHKLKEKKPQLTLAQEEDRLLFTRCRGQMYARMKTGGLWDNIQVFYNKFLLHMK